MLTMRKIENVLLTILTSLAGFAVTFLKDLSHSVQELNQQMIIVIEKMGKNTNTIMDHEDRIRSIERGNR